MMFAKWDKDLYKSQDHLLNPIVCYRCNCVTTMFVWVYDAQRGKKALVPYANSKGRDDRAHPCSLIWTFSVRRHIL